jgi:uncharacterized protein (DUF1501 family)
MHPFTPSDRKCLSRRQLLQVGSISMLGLDLPQLLHASASTKSGQRGSEKSCIFISMYGGPSQLDTWDLKPHAPTEIRGPFKPIATATPGMQICELMPQLARLSNRLSVVRSMTHRQADHTKANSMMLCGQSNPSSDAPSFGAVMAKLRPAQQNIPSYVWLQKFGGGAMPPDASYLSGGFLGAAYGPMAIGTKDHTEDPSAPGFRVRVFDSPGDIPSDRVQVRQQLLEHLEPAQQRTPGANFRRMQERAFDLVTGPQARQAFDLNQEPARIRQRYGMHPLGQNLLMARRLVEAGVRLVGVVAWTGLKPGEKFFSVETWDMHGVGGPIFGDNWNGLGFALPRFDQATAALLTDLEERGLLDNTLVVAVGEFGRTPKIDGNGKGRDHWPYCFPALLAGAGIRGGMVYGASDKIAAYPRDNPVSPEDFGATLFQALGVAPETRLGLDGFTRPASTGTAIAELIG